MAIYSIKVLQKGQLKNTLSTWSDEPHVINMQDHMQIQIRNASTQALVRAPKTRQIGGDLWVFLSEGKEQPDLILKNYNQFQFDQGGAESTFSTASYSPSNTAEVDSASHTLAKQSAPQSESHASKSGGDFDGAGKLLLGGLLIGGVAYGVGELVDEINEEGNVIDGTDDSENISGTPLNDIIYGRDGNDVLSGFWGDDQLYGGEGNDKLYGGLGNDILNGGRDTDILEGGPGSDIFVFDTPIGGLYSTNIDRIIDFNPAVDKIRLGSNIFSNIKSAADVKALIEYDVDTGFISYDGTRFAKISTDLDLTVANFEIV